MKQTKTEHLKKGDIFCKSMKKKKLYEVTGITKELTETKIEVINKATGKTEKMSTNGMPYVIVLD